MKLTPEDYRTIEAYTGRKLKFIPDLENKIKQSAYIARQIIRGL